MKIVFMGTPDFAVPSLERLIADGHEIIAVITQPDRPQSRGMKMTASPVKECALKYNIPVYQPEKIKKDREFIEKYRQMNPELAVVVAFGQILSKELLDIPQKGNINVHGSLLPKYRGAAPIQWSVINGDKETGVTTMFMDEGMDTGDMLLKEVVEIGAEETAGELFDRLSLLGAEVLSKTIDKLQDGTLTREKQNHDEATHVSMISKDLGKLDFNKTSKELDCLIRGVNPWPGAYFEINGKKIKVHKARVCEQTGKAGEILASDAKKGLIIATKDSSIELIEIQPEGKRRMTAKEYLIGNKI
ncbi:MAG: methionyl-tRNA formyltransferase [Clostridiales bacterium]|nr:methionyl-tRNA formyltransferase [Clostridiales bacterium]